MCEQKWEKFSYLLAHSSHMQFLQLFVPGRGSLRASWGLFTISTEDCRVTCAHIYIHINETQRIYGSLASHSPKVACYRTQLCGNHTDHAFISLSLSFLLYMFFSQYKFFF